MRRNWKARWFTLTETSLSYYTASDCSTQKGTISFADKQDVEVHFSTDTESKRKREYCFTVGIKSQEKRYIIDAQSKLEVDAWVAAIQRVLES